MLKRLLKIITIGLLLNILVACYDKNEFKREIEERYERIYAGKNFKGVFCLYIGEFKFPYTAELIKETDNVIEKSIKQTLSRTLPLFTEMGLVTRQEIAGQANIYRYDLTELGRQYHRLSSQRLRSGEIYNSNSFCYGVIKVDKVTKIEERKFENVRRPYNYEVEVDYDFHVLDVPEWAVTYKDKIDERYWGSYLEGISYEGTIVYQDGGEGYLKPIRGLSRGILFKPVALKGEE